MAYVKTSRVGKGRILDHVVEFTGWSRDNARRRVTAAVNSVVLAVMIWGLSYAASGSPLNTS